MNYLSRPIPLFFLICAAVLLTSCSSSDSSSPTPPPQNIFRVTPAESIYNLFSGIDIPQNPGMAENNWSGGHQDSYCSESVGLSGPTTEYVKVLERENPYGFVPIMACNSNNQMIGAAFNYNDGFYRLLVFDENLNILSATPFSEHVENSFGGGYFFLDNDENAIMVGYNKIQAYPTSNVEAKNGTHELTPLWISEDIVKLVTGSSDNNALYGAMPIWDETKPHTYWCLLAGSVSFSGSGKVILNGNAYMALVEIVPDASEPDGCTTILIDSMELAQQWNNNTFAVDEEGAYFVTNGVNAEGICDFGYLHALAFDEETQTIVSRWQYAYENSGLYKIGMANIGSGTTPSVMKDDAGRKFVAIGDNAVPKMHVDVVNHGDGKLFDRVAVFSSMRSADEASFIAVNNYIGAENNFGHVFDPPNSQLTPNEPGLTMIKFDPDSLDLRHETLWEYNQDSIFAMSMLARESGVIFAATGSWDDSISATKGGMYYITAFDSLEGRVFWKIPLGRGFDYCHEYGGIYFNRDGNLFMGTNGYLYSIQAYEE